MKFSLVFGLHFYKIKKYLTIGFFGMFLWSLWYIYLTLIHLLQKLWSYCWMYY